LSTALQQKTCREYLSLLGPFLDGELDAPGMLEVESHVADCVPCGEHVALLRASRASLKRTVRRNAPEGLRARLEIAMAAEATRGEAREAETRTGGKLLGWRTVVPLASAAALALAWGATRTPAKNTQEQVAGFGDDLLSEIVAEHAAPLPPDATDPRAVRNLEKYVGVPVRPGSFERGGARLVGGRVLPMRSQRAAMLQFVVMNGDEPRRVSLFVYDPSKIQVVSPGLAPRAVGTARVAVGQARGYSVAVTQHGGVGCALATDMSADVSAQLALAACDE
jgi:anti-sigma factor RsiW